MKGHRPLKVYYYDFVIKYDLIYTVTKYSRANVVLLNATLNILSEITQNADGMFRELDNNKG